MGPSDLLEPSSFDAMWSLGLVAVGIGFVVTIALAVRNAHHLHRNGIDPTTVEAELATRMLRSQALAPAAEAAAPGRAERSVEDRLAEIDGLHARGAISDQERAAARSEVLKDL